MIKKIETLTPQQWDKIPEYINKWINIASDKTDINASTKIINKLYQSVNLKPPMILHFTSPILCHFALTLLRNQLGNQLENQLGNQLRNQLRSQLENQLLSQLENQLENQLWNQLGNQLRNQLWNQLGNQLWNQLGNQLRNQLLSQLENQLLSQLENQLENQLWNQLGNQLGNQLWNQLGNQITPMWLLAYSGWFNYSDEIIGVNFNKIMLNDFLQFTSNIHFCLPYENIFIYSYKPTAIHWENKRLHNESAMAVKYEDGWGWYCLNGIVMKPEYILTPSNEITPKMILSEKDVDQRRELIHKVGIIKMVNNGKLLDTLGEYKLYDMTSIIGNGYNPYLLMPNHSVENTWHLEGVSEQCRTCEQALNYRKPAEMRKIPIDVINGEDWFQQGDICIWPRKALSLKPYPKVLT